MKNAPEVIVSLPKLVAAEVRRMQKDMVVGGMYEVEALVSSEVWPSVELTPGDVLSHVQALGPDLTAISAGMFTFGVNEIEAAVSGDLVVLLSDKLLVAVSGIFYSFHAFVLHPVHGPCWIGLVLIESRKNLEIDVWAQLNRVAKDGDASEKL